MPSDGARDDHGDDGDNHKMIKCSTFLEKEVSPALLIIKQTVSTFTAYAYRRARQPKRF